MGKTVVFLGAGATKACKGFLTNEILPEIHRRMADPASGWSLTLLKRFLEGQFHVTSVSPKEHYPGLPLVMSLIDTALGRRQSFGSDWDVAAVSQLREEVEFGIFDLLEERLEKSPTNNHWDLLNRLYPPGGEEPCVISTNYDLIVDTALMFLSESRPLAGAMPEGRLPDYRCHISTDFYRNEPARFGTLLKLHGSLNWLYCKTCLRMELGASEARSYLKVLGRLVGPDLKTSYTDGHPCPTCGTKLRPLLIAPTHLKDYRNPHLAQVWYEAECVLREATRIVFVGYSLPDDDVEVVYLLKRSLTRANPPQITIIEYDKDYPDLPVTDHAAGRRYRTLFGDDIDWHACGLDDWLMRQQPGVQR
ncbi:MAG TPA: hypothetical protein VE398_10490 [Acidobacteriota bacterium]|nr:hypothetical protein [Acidobacteriota bacterium]